MDAPFFWARIAKDPVTGCWNWTGKIAHNGYGVGRNDVRSHRFAYEMLVGPIPEGLCIDHLCRNKACCNPEHLEVVTLGENVLRGNSIPARNARKTHCKHGHEFTPENTYIYKRKRHPFETMRMCMICRKRLSTRQSPTAASIAPRDSDQPVPRIDAHTETGKRTPQR